MNTMLKLLTPTMVGCALLLGTAATQVGCDQKETILDVETPGGELEVEQDKETGEVDVEANRD